jgi:hypothetical protein
LREIATIFCLLIQIVSEQHSTERMESSRRKTEAASSAAESSPSVLKSHPQKNGGKKTVWTKNQKTSLMTSTKQSVMH